MTEKTKKSGNVEKLENPERILFRAGTKMVAALKLAEDVLECDQDKEFKCVTEQGEEVYLGLTDMLLMSGDIKKAFGEAKIEALKLEWEL